MLWIDPRVCRKRQHAEERQGQHRPQRPCNECRSHAQSSRLVRPVGQRHPRLRSHALDHSESRIARQLCLRPMPRRHLQHHVLKGDLRTARQVCPWTTIFLPAGRLSVSVALNLSGSFWSTLRQRDLESCFNRILSETKLDPSFIDVETTEIVPMRYP